VADLAAEWRLPVLLVAPVRLGTVGQLVAAAEFARGRGLDVRAIVLSQAGPVEGDPTQLAPVPLIENLCRLPVLGTLPHLDDPGDRRALATACAGLWLEPIAFGAGAIRAG
jgi:dethiobiotin synthetase